MHKVLVTGANGQLGKALAYTQGNYPNLSGLFESKETLDVTNPQQLHQYIKQHAINYVINCAAYTNVDQAETTQGLATSVNTEAPAHLASLATVFSFTLFHISTDYVFKGDLAQPLEETMPTEPVTYYGQS